MKLLAHLRSWLKWIVKPQRLENEMETEVRFHIESYAADLVRSGVSQQEAMRRAHIEFGGIESHKDAVRARLGLRLWGELCADLRYGARMLRRNPAFTMVVVLILALGIGANTAIFSLIDAVMLRMLPVQKPEQLILLKWASQTQPGTMPGFVRSLSGDADQDEKGRFASTSFSYPIFEDIQRGSSGRPVKVRASAPTEFEMQVQRLGLTEENYESSDHLRRWCEDNRHRFYDSTSRSGY
jgi:hypothetical protein